MKVTSATAVSALVATASAHGFVQQIMLGENLVNTWNPYKDPSKKVEKITRKFKDNGPVTDGLFEVCSNYPLVLYQWTLTRQPHRPTPSPATSEATRITSPPRKLPTSLLEALSSSCGLSGRAIIPARVSGGRRPTSMNG